MQLILENVVNKMDQLVPAQSFLRRNDQAHGRPVYSHHHNYKVLK